MIVTSSRDIGGAIKAARLAKGWSQAALAERLDTSQRWVSEIENGKKRAEIGRVLLCLRYLGIAITLTHKPEGEEDLAFIRRVDRLVAAKRERKHGS